MQSNKERLRYIPMVERHVFYVVIYDINEATQRPVIGPLFILFSFCIVINYKVIVVNVHHAVLLK
jgi:hypothetical protein